MAAVQITNRKPEASSNTPLFDDAVRPLPSLHQGERDQAQPFARAPVSESTLAQELDQVRTLMRHCLDHASDLPAARASRYQIDTGGSLLRARMALISGRHFDADTDYRIASAAACELMHNASLVHDDLCDGDTHRRGHATVWNKFNRAVALCTGDLLMCAAFMAATEVAGAQQSQQLSRCLARHTRTVIAGQSLEVASAPSALPDLRGYLKATQDKTAPFILLPLEVGALGGNATPDTLRQLTRIANAIGLAYQIVDDLDDLAEGKESFHPYHAWHHHQPPAQGADPQERDTLLALNQSLRHARAALKRAHQQLAMLSTVLHEALEPTLQSLNERVSHHRETLPHVISNCP